MTADRNPGEASARRAVRVSVSGRVQGVWFRAWTVETATGLGLNGWVRNRADGTVEAVFAGPPATVDAMLVACHEGPEGARVDAVVTDVLDVAEALTLLAGFRQHPTV